MEHVLLSTKKNGVEACSAYCGGGGQATKGCKKFTWQLSNNKTCWLFKNNDLVGTYEFGSYSGIARGWGEAEMNLLYERPFLFK